MKQKIKQALDEQKIEKLRRKDAEKKENLD
jgi:hypothetical protein